MHVEPTAMAPVRLQLRGPLRMSDWATMSLMADSVHDVRACTKADKM